MVACGRKSSVTKRFFADAMVDPPPIGNKGALWNEIQGKNREEGVLAQPHCHVVPPVRLLGRVGELSSSHSPAARACVLAVPMGSQAR